MTLVTGTTIDPSLIHDLSERFQEPEWARVLREKAFSAYRTLPLPREDESWRNLSLRDVPLQSIVPYAESDSLSVESLHRMQLPLEANAVFYNNRLQQLHQEPAFKAKGIIFTSLLDAIKEHGELVGRYLGKLYEFEENKFAALHYALRSDGVFLYVPQNVVMDQPIRVVTYADQPNVGVFNHTLIVVEENAQVDLVEYSISSLQGGECIHCGAVEIFAAEGAKVSYTALQNFDEGIYSFNPRRAHLDNHAEVKWFVCEMGSRMARSESTSYLEGEGAFSEAVVAFFAGGKQNLDVSAGMIHTGNHGVSHIVAKGMMKDQGKTIWRGLGHIKQGAKNCKTFQEERSLTLSRESHGDAIPGLLIEETDVLGAGHSAAVGQIDEEQLFYLMSRGISREQANRMIVEGFFGCLLDRIPAEAIRQETYQLIQRKLGGSNV